MKLTLERLVRQSVRGLRQSLLHATWTDNEDLTGLPEFGVVVFDVGHTWQLSIPAPACFVVLCDHAPILKRQGQGGSSRPPTSRPEPVRASPRRTKGDPSRRDDVLGRPESHVQPAARSQGSTPAPARFSKEHEHERTHHEADGPGGSGSSRPRTANITPSTCGGWPTAALTTCAMDSPWRSSWATTSGAGRCRPRRSGCDRNLCGAPAHPLVRSSRGSFRRTAPGARERQRQPRPGPICHAGRGRHRGLGD